MPWQNRIIGEGSKRASEFRANPRNWRRHPTEQKRAVLASLAELGWVQRVIENARTGLLVDGHERVEEALANGDQQVPFLLVDLSPEEERLALALLDPLSAMATADMDALDSLIRDTTPNSDVLRNVLSDLANQRAVEELPTEFAAEDQSSELSDSFRILVHCEDETQQAELLERLISEGFQCRAMIA